MSWNPYLISVSTAISNPPAPIIQDFINCQQGFEFSITYGVPAPPPDGPGGAISFWPGAEVGGPELSDWLFQPLLTQAEFDGGWQAAPAIFVAPAEGNPVQLGWDDGVVSPGSTLFVPRPGDLIKSRIRFDKASGNWEQSMHDITTGEFFEFYVTAGNTYRGQFVCPDNANCLLVWFTMECEFTATDMNIWQNKIDAHAAFSVDGLAQSHNFANANNWTGAVGYPVPGVGLKLGEDQFIMELPTRFAADSL